MARRSGRSRRDSGAPASLDGSLPSRPQGETAQQRRSQRSRQAKQAKQAVRKALNKALGSSNPLTELVYRTNVNELAELPRNELHRLCVILKVNQSLIDFGIKQGGTNLEDFGNPDRLQAHLSRVRRDDVIIREHDQIGRGLLEAGINPSACFAIIAHGLRDGSRLFMGGNRIGVNPYRDRIRTLVTNHGQAQKLLDNTMKTLVRSGAVDNSKNAFSINGDLSAVEPQALRDFIGFISNNLGPLRERFGSKTSVRLKFAAPSSKVSSSKSAAATSAPAKRLPEKAAEEKKATLPPLGAEDKARLAELFLVISGKVNEKADASAITPQVQVLRAKLEGHSFEREEAQEIQQKTMEAAKLLYSAGYGESCFELSSLAVHLCGQSAGASAALQTELEAGCEFSGMIFIEALGIDAKTGDIRMKVDDMPKMISGFSTMLRTAKNRDLANDIADDFIGVAIQSNSILESLESLSDDDEMAQLLFEAAIEGLQA